jgi:hypothetical protein
MLLLRSLLPFVGLLCLPCRAAGPVELQRLYGTWELSPEAKEVVPMNCQSLSYEFDAKSITVKTGELRMVTQYEVETGASELSLRQIVTAHNGKPSCGGASVSYAIGQRVRNLDVDILEDRLRIHISGRGGARSVELVRSTKS